MSLFDVFQRRTSDDDVELPHVSDDELLAWANDLRATPASTGRTRRERPLVADPA